MNCPKCKGTTTRMMWGNIAMGRWACKDCRHQWTAGPEIENQKMTEYTGWDNYVKLKDWITIPTLARDVDTHFKTAPGDIIRCKCCGKDYERGYWDFYNLCDFCHGNYQNSRGKSYRYYSDVEEFLKDRLCKH